MEKSSLWQRYCRCIPNCYSVAAIDASGNESPRSAELCAVLTGCAASVYDRIEPSLTIVSSNEIRMRWGVSASSRWRNTGSTATVRCLKPWRPVSTDQFNYYTYSDTNLSPGTGYCYAVAAAGDETQGCDQLCISTWP